MCQSEPYSWYSQKDGGLSGCRTGGHHVGRNRRWKDCSLGDFGLFRPSFVGKSADTEAGVSASNIVRKRILFFPGKAFSQMLGNMSVTKMVVPDTDYTDGSSNGGGDNSNPSGGNDGDQGENPLG